MPGTVKIKLTAALLTAALLFPFIAFSHAEEIGSGYRNDGEDSGLSITVPDPPTDISHLNPGDQKSSRLRLENTGGHTLYVYLKTQIDSENAPGGGRLSDDMKLTIRDGSTYLAQGRTFQAAASDGSVMVGMMTPGSIKALDFSVDMPGEATDNRFQGASMAVEWIFTVQYGGPSSGGGGGNHGGGGGGTTYDSGSGFAGGTIGDSSLPAGSSAPNSESTSASSKPQPMPASKPESQSNPIIFSPATGERSATLIHVIGAIIGILLAGGIFLFSFRRAHRV